MPGFADVTGWSSRDIQRLGHEDDDTPNTRTYRNKPKQPVLNFTADTVWGAACAAQRINGEYIKDGQNQIGEFGEVLSTKLRNRDIMLQFLHDPALLLEEDIEQAKKVRQYFQAYTFKILKGTKLSEFDNNAMLISNRDFINTSYDVAVIASLPSSYERGLKRGNVDQRVKFATGGYIGTSGDKITVTIEVLKTVYSQKWNTSYFTGITSEDQVVFFAYNHIDRLEIGDTYTIQGTVKTHRDNSTQLNRVRVI
jgi:hypothetical protein